MSPRHLVYVVLWESCDQGCEVVAVFLRKSAAESEAKRLNDRQEDKSPAADVWTVREAMLL